MASESMSFSGVSARESAYNRSHSISFRDILNGDKAFYNQPDYLKATKRDFAQVKPLLVNYT